MTVSYQQEFTATIASEMKKLVEDHWEEIALNKERIRLNPDWDGYVRLEESGILKCFTARDGQVLVGYFIVFCRPHIHYMDHVFAVNDVIYLRPDYRRGRTGIGLIRFAERCLADDGVSVLLINTKAHRPFDAVLERLGFSLTERVYGKYIGGN